jgi:hypothetical protein
LGDAKVPDIPKWIVKSHFHEVLILKFLILGQGKLSRCIGCEVSGALFAECFDGFDNTVLSSLDCGVNLFL